MRRYNSVCGILGKVGASKILDWFFSVGSSTSCQTRGLQTKRRNVCLQIAGVVSEVCTTAAMARDQLTGSGVLCGGLGVGLAILNCALGGCLGLGAVLRTLGLVALLHRVRNLTKKQEKVVGHLQGASMRPTWTAFWRRRSPPRGAAS